MIEKIILDNKNAGYDTKWEVALYDETDEYTPYCIAEYSLGEEEGLLEYIKQECLDYNNTKIEIALIGQDEEGHNETCYIVRTIK